jgi:hypothetical protein
MLLNGRLVCKCCELAVACGKPPLELFTKVPGVSFPDNICVMETTDAEIPVCMAAVKLVAFGVIGRVRIGFLG